MKNRLIEIDSMRAMKNLETIKIVNRAWMMMNLINLH